MYGSWFQTVIELQCYCVLCRSQPSTVPRVQHHGHSLPDEGHRAGHGHAASLAPHTLLTHQLHQHAGRGIAQSGAESNHHCPLQSSSPLALVQPQGKARHVPVFETSEMWEKQQQ